MEGTVMLCSTCETPLVPGRLFCMNCGETSPEGAKIMGIAPRGEAIAETTVPAVVPTVPVAAVAYRQQILQSGTTSVSAVVSFVLGCLGWLGMPVIGAIGAVVSGHVARREIRQSGGRLVGGGLATAGLVLGYVQVGLIASAAITIAAIAMTAVALGG
jgi:hypothetical protein